MDTPALAIPGQQELTLALMELLVQVARQIAGAGFAVSHVQVFNDYRTLKNKS